MSKKTTTTTMQDLIDAGVAQPLQCGCIHCHLGRMRFMSEEGRMQYLRDHFGIAPTPEAGDE